MNIGSMYEMKKEFCPPPPTLCSPSYRARAIAYSKNYVKI